MGIPLTDAQHAKAIRKGLDVLEDALREAAADGVEVKLGIAVGNGWQSGVDRSTNFEICTAKIVRPLPDKALVELRWQEPHPSHSYPNWYAYDADIKFEARIDTARPLCFGKFPLKINGHDYGTKFETLEEAKAFAQKKYEERLAPIYAKFTAALSNSPVVGEDAPRGSVADDPRNPWRGPLKPTPTDTADRREALSFYLDGEIVRAKDGSWCRPASDIEIELFTSLIAGPPEGHKFAIGDRVTEQRR